MAQPNRSTPMPPKEIAEREAVRPPQPAIANPGALGLAGFALTTLVLNVVNTGLIKTEALGMVLPMGVFYGGLAQFMAGMWDIRRGDVFGGTCFSSFGAFWMGFALMLYLQLTGIMAPVPQGGMVVFLIIWGIFTGYASIASLKVSKGVTAVFVTLTLLFFLLAAGEYSSVWHKIAGWEGLLCAGIAFYCSAAVLINGTWGREVLPLGHAKK